ncbi:hypothetical protein ACVWXO_011069 [Bradyrhizobium sp. LM2.7]
MAVATYGSDDVEPVASARGAVLHRPFQVFIIAADFLLILLCYAAASLFYSGIVGSSADGASIGAGLIVGAVFVAIAYFHGVYATHRLLNLVWQLRKTVIIWLASLTILAVAAFLLKSTDNLSRGTITRLCRCRRPRTGQSPLRLAAYTRHEFCEGAIGGSQGCAA